MKRVVPTLLLVIFFIYAQAQDLKSTIVGNAKDFASFIKNTENPSGRADSEKPVIQLKTPKEGVEINGLINAKRVGDNYEEIIGEVSSNGGFFLEADESGLVSGYYTSVKDKIAYRYYTDEKTGNLLVKEVDIHDVLCIDFEATPEVANGDEGYPLKATNPVPLLESLPGAEAVVYLDFDGEVVSNSRWNNGRTINARSFNYSDDIITTQWEIVAEDYRPFEVNVTTDRSVFDRAPRNKRMMCIVTPTNDAAPGAGGVAYLNSFSDGRDDPCWTFNRGDKTGGETNSHEVGHTVGLNHDGKGGDTYYMGHDDWAPIMGASYRRPVGHWSKGEYSGATNREDDLNIIVSRNGFGYLPDDAGNTTNDAKELVVSATGEVDEEENKGLIEKNTDIDVFKFSAGVGEVQLKIDPFYKYPNLNIKARLLNEQGNEVASDDPKNTMSASISVKVDAGTYYLELDGVGNGDPSTSYSDYNSMGGYTITGTIPAGGTLPSAAFESDKQMTCAGQTIQFTDLSEGDPTEWEWEFEGGDPENSDDQNPEVTYNEPGTYKVTLTVTNDNGSDTETKEEFITISEPASLPVQENFESSFPPEGWEIVNEDEATTWEKSEETGVGSDACLVIKNATYDKVGQKDALILKETDFSGSKTPILSFFVAYTRFDEDSEDVLSISVSEDCGESWEEIYEKTKKELETKDVDFDESQDWIPEDIKDWRYEAINLEDYTGTKSLIVKFENTNGYGNNIWIDKINIDYNVSVDDENLLDNNLVVAPNPTNSTFELRFNTSTQDNYRIEVRNILGKVVYEENLLNFRGTYNNSIDLSGYSKGVYLLKVKNSEKESIRKVVKN